MKPGRQRAERSQQRANFLANQYEFGTLRGDSGVCEWPIGNIRRLELCSRELDFHCCHSRITGLGEFLFTGGFVGGRKQRRKMRLTCFPPSTSFVATRSGRGEVKRVPISGAHSRRLHERAPGFERVRATSDDFERLRTTSGDFGRVRATSSGSQTLPTTSTDFEPHSRAKLNAIPAGQALAIKVTRMATLLEPLRGLIAARLWFRSSPRAIRHLNEETRTSATTSHNKSWRGLELPSSSNWHSHSRT